MRCRLGAGTLFLENSCFTWGTSVASLRGPSPPGGALGGSEGQKRIKKNFLSSKLLFLTSPGQICCFFLSLLSLSSSKSLFSSSWSLLVSILSSQADPPTFKNVGFMRAGARFSKNHGFGSKDALDGVLGLSWAHFGCSWGLLGGSFGAFAGFRWHLACSKLLSGLP